MLNKIAYKQNQSGKSPKYALVGGISSWMLQGIFPPFNSLDFKVVVFSFGYF